MNSKELFKWDFKKLRDKNKPVIPNDRFVFKFTSVPVTVYVPEMDYIQSMINNIDIQANYSHQPMQYQLKGYVFSSNGRTSPMNGSLSIMFIDRVDLSLTHSLQSWVNAMHDPSTHDTSANSDTMAEAELITFSHNNIPLKYYKFYNLFPVSYDVGDGSYSYVQQQTHSNIRYSMMFDYHEKKILTSGSSVPTS